MAKNDPAPQPTTKQIKVDMSISELKQLDRMVEDFRQVIKQLTLITGSLKAIKEQGGAASGRGRVLPSREEINQGDERERTIFRGGGAGTQPLYEKYEGMFLPGDITAQMLDAAEPSVESGGGGRGRGTRSSGAGGGGRGRGGGGRYVSNDRRPPDRHNFMDYSDKNRFFTQGVPIHSNMRRLMDTMPGHFGGRWTAQDYLMGAQSFIAHQGWMEGRDEQTGRRDFVYPGEGGRLRSVTDRTENALNYMQEMGSEEVTLHEVADEHGHSDWLTPAEARARGITASDIANAGQPGSAVRQSQTFKTDSEGTVDDKLFHHFSGLSSMARVAGRTGIGGRAISGFAQKLYPGISKMLEAVPRVSLFAGAAISAIKGAQAVEGAIYAPAKQGMNLGYAQPGINPFAGGAASEFGGSQFRALTAGGFGFNPYMSVGEANKINQDIHAAGWVGTQRYQMFNAVSDARSRYGLDITTSVQQLDQAFRQGSSSIQAFSEVLKDIPSAARAARMTVTEYQQQLYQSANAVQGQTGMGFTEATQAITGISRATNYNPQISSQILTNQNLQVYGANALGMQYGQYLNNPGAQVLGNIEAIRKLFQSTFHIPLEQLPNNPDVQGQVRIAMQGMGGTFMGFNMDQLMQMAQDPNYDKRAGASATLTDITYDKRTGSYAIRNPMNDQTTTTTNRSQINDLITQTLQTAGVSSKDLTKFKQGMSGWSPDLEVRKAQQLLSNLTSNQMNNADSTQVIIGFQGYAEQILKAHLANPKGNANDAYSQGTTPMVSTAGRMSGALQAINNANSGG